MLIHGTRFECRVVQPCTFTVEKHLYFSGHGAYVGRPLSVRGWGRVIDQMTGTVKITRLSDGMGLWYSLRDTGRKGRAYTVHMHRSTEVVVDGVTYTVESLFNAVSSV